MLMNSPVSTEPDASYKERKYIKRRVKILHTQKLADIVYIIYHKRNYSKITPVIHMMAPEGSNEIYVRTGERNSKLVRYTLK